MVNERLIVARAIPLSGVLGELADTSSSLLWSGENQDENGESSKTQKQALWEMTYFRCLSKREYTRYQPGPWSVLVGVVMMGRWE